jgi:hypothetical protein
MVVPATKGTTMRDRASNIHHQDEFRVLIVGSNAICDYDYVQSQILFACHLGVEKKIIIHLVQSERADVHEFINWHLGHQLDAMTLDLSQGVAPFQVIGMRGKLTAHRVDCMYDDPEDSDPMVHVLEFTFDECAMVARPVAKRPTLKLV